MTSFNYENFIAQAVESVINQTVPDWELLIIDDGSKDNSVNIIKEYCQKDSRIKLLTHPHNSNKGLVKSVKYAVSQAQYDWIAFLESDDFWAPEYLEEKIKFIEKYPQINFVYNDTLTFGNEQKQSSMAPYFERLYKLWQDKATQDVFNAFGEENIVPTFSCVMCKKDTFLSCNLNPVCEPLFDFWVWWQISENNDFGFINKKLTHWRFHKGSYLAKSMKTYKHHIERSLFISKVTKLFKRQPKLCLQFSAEKNALISALEYTVIYIKRKIPCFIKDLFKAG